MKKWFQKVCIFFGIKKEDIHTLSKVFSVSEKGFLSKTISSKQQAVIDSRERNMRKDAKEQGITFVSFREFYEKIFPEAASASFKYRLFLWRYNHLVSIALKKKVPIDGNHSGRFDTAVLVASVIVSAKDSVIINVNDRIKTILSLTICRNAVVKAKEKGVNLIIVPIPFDQKFSVMNDVGMSQHQLNLFGYDTLISLIPSR